MSAKLVLLLHSHLPYVKRQGRWPFGEVWLFEGMAETYIPLLRTWRRLAEDGINAPITVSVSPTLLEQLASPYIQEQFVEYVKQKEKLALADEKYFLASGERHMAELAHDYVVYYRDIRRDFLTEYDADLIGAIRSHLNSDAQCEFIATAGTHAYLPLIRDRRSLQRQVSKGAAVFEKHFHRRPEGFWLPECGYYEGLEDILLDYGFRYFFVDSHALEGGFPAQIASHGEIEPAEELETEEESFFQSTGLSTYSPYLIKDKPIAVFGRNAMVSYQVWSQDYGYPGDGAYRDFHKQSSRSGLKYWRVTNRQGDMGQKSPYDPDVAAKLVRWHAAHFTDVVSNTAREARKMGFNDPLIVACYDTELFGHWWSEGVLWLDQLARQIAVHSAIDMQVPGQVLAERTGLSDAQVFESSWGVGGKHFGWYNKETGWMWQTIQQARDEYEEAAARENTDLTTRIVRQAERELMLMESSDWFFMVTNNHTRDYAMKRFFEHYAKLMRLTDMLKTGRLHEANLTWLAKVEEEDEIFTL